LRRADPLRAPRIPGRADIRLMSAIHPKPNSNERTTRRGRTLTRTYKEHKYWGMADATSLLNRKNSLLAGNLAPLDGLADRPQRKPAAISLLFAAFRR
jgi:hypothetical protein